MRLICPNCGAEYEVPDEVIPESGRDVQCSNCGDTWFQHHPDHAPDPDETQQTEPEWRQEQAPEVDASEADEQDAPDTYDIPDDVQDEAEAPSPQPERRELDPAIADVLREEAALEEQARKAEMGSGIETQQELGLEERSDDALRRSEQARARMARLRGLPEESTDADQDEDIDPSSRRNLLPDIEEINSSLNAEKTRDEPVTPPGTDGSDAMPVPRKSGFRSGFRTAILLAVLALLVYVFAPRIGAAIPALEAPLISYVDLINSGRTALSEMVTDFAGSLSEDSAAQ